MVKRVGRQFCRLGEVRSLSGENGRKLTASTHYPWRARRAA